MITFITGVTIGPPPASYVEIFDSVKNERYRFNLADGISPKNLEDRVLAIFQEGVITYQCLFVDISNPAGTVTQKFNAISELFIVDSAISGTVAITAVSLPLPTGASTSANQTTEITSLGTLITNTTGIATAANQATEITSLGTLISTGIATAANQATEITSLGTLITNTTGIATAANQATEITSLGTLITNTTGIATAANQATEITALTSIGTVLTSIDAGIPVSLGQTTMAASMPVVFASNQTALPVSVVSLSAANRSYNSINLGSVPVSMSLAVTNYLAIGLRLKIANIANIVNIVSVVANAYTNDHFIWTITENPTFSAPPVFASYSATSYVETTIGTGAITLTSAGNVLVSGYSIQNFATTSGTNFVPLEFIQLKTTGAGTPIIYILSITPLSPGADILASLNIFQI